MLRLTVVLALTLAAASPGAAWAASWTVVGQKDGITVTTREVTGRDFPTFRGVGVVHGNLFQVLADADPGGLLPTWLATRATRWLPLRTLQGLRRQVKRTRGWYGARIKKWKAGGY